MEKLGNKEAGKKSFEAAPIQSSCSNNLDSEVFREVDKLDSDNVFVVERVVNGSVCRVKSSRPSVTSDTEDIPSKHTISTPTISGKSSEDVQAIESCINRNQEIAIDVLEEPGSTLI